MEILGKTSLRVKIRFTVIYIYVTLYICLIYEKVVVIIL